MHSHLIHENPADYGGEASSRRAPSVARLQTWARPLAGARTPQEGARLTRPRRAKLAVPRLVSRSARGLRPRALRRQGCLVSPGMASPDFSLCRWAVPG